MDTLTELAKKCCNYIRMIGTLVEWNVDVYKKNDTVVVKYIGVVNCGNAYINIKGVLTQYDDLFHGFVNEFKDENIIGERVYIHGALNSQCGVTVSYITKVQDVDRFEGQVSGIPILKDKILVVDNEYHQIIPLQHNCCNSNMVTVFDLSINPLQTDNDGKIIKDGFPPFTTNTLVMLDKSAIIPQHLIDQALEEHEIYLESMGQRTSG